SVRAVIVVTMPDHSRRWRRIAHRTMYRQHTRVLVRPAHYSPFDPDRWRESRDGVRTAVMELEKLLVDVVRHPISCRASTCGLERALPAPASAGRRNSSPI